MEKKPSLEHTRLLIQEKIENLKISMGYLSQHPEGSASLAIYQQELAGHEQGLKACNNHYALLEALKEVNNEIDKYWNGNKSEVQIKKIVSAQRKSLEAIKQCEE